MWNLWEKLNERGIGDKSEEGQDLRDAIREYIDANELNVRVTRGKTNEDLLNDIEDALEVAKDGSNNEDDNTQNDTKPEDTVRRRGEHNDDTNEPAANPVRERRAARPERRRR